MMEIAERNPAMVQIAVDMSFGLIPVSRARSEFVDDARTATPKRVRPKGHQSAVAITGTTMMASSCDPLMVTLPKCHSLVIGLGNAVRRRRVRYPGKVSV